MDNYYRKGVVVAGRYRIERELDAGGMGSLFIALQQGFDREVALKILPNKTLDRDPTARDRFVLEAKAVCHLKHPNIVTYYDFGTDPATGQMYLVMELLEGQSLARVLKNESPIPTSRVVHMIVQLCGALAEAHAGRVIHRDLKPGNIMLVRRGTDPDFVKLIDFGIVRLLEKTSNRKAGATITQTGMIIGTTGYLAPEYIRHQTVDERVDIYALGVICYELLAGCRPFVDRDPTRVLHMHLKDPPPPLVDRQDGRDWSQLGPLSAVIMRALAKKPDDRFRTVSAFRDAVIGACRPLMVADAAEATRLQRGVPGTDGAELATAVRDVPVPTPVARKKRATIEHDSMARGRETREATPPRSTGTHPRTSPTNASGLTEAEIGPATSKRLWIAFVALVILAFAGTLGVIKLLEKDSPGPATGSADQNASAEPAPPAIAEAGPRTEEQEEPLPRASEEAARAEPGAVEMPQSVLAVELRVREAETPRALHRRGPVDPVVVAKPARPPAIPDAVAVPAPPRPSKSKKKYPVKIVIRPHGSAYFGGRLLGKGSMVQARITEGKQCFRAKSPVTGKSSKRCITVGAGHNTVSIDVR